MARGRLRCIGNSLRLKARFGSGYRVSIRVQGGGAAAAGAWAGGGGPLPLSSGAQRGLLPTESGEIQPEPLLAGEEEAAAAAAAGETRQRDPAAARQAAGVRALFAAQLGIKPSEQAELLQSCGGVQPPAPGCMRCLWPLRCQRCAVVTPWSRCGHAVQATSPSTTFTSWCLTSWRGGCPHSSPTSRQGRHTRGCGAAGPCCSLPRARPAAARCPAHAVLAPQGACRARRPDRRQPRCQPLRQLPGAGSRRARCCCCHAGTRLGAGRGGCAAAADPSGGGVPHGGSQGGAGVGTGGPVAVAVNTHSCTPGARVCRQRPACRQGQGCRLPRLPAAHCRNARASRRRVLPCPAPPCPCPCPAPPCSWRGGTRRWLWRRRAWR